MRLCSIPPRLPFLDTVAQRWLHRAVDPSRGLILLPTRRAARALVEAFLRAGGGRPMLLPRVMALGALDEAPLTLAGALDLPPAVAPARRLAVLSRLILALPPAEGGARTAEAAWKLAAELAALMDEAERAEIDLPEALERVVDAGTEYARHWQITLRFLSIVTRAWPAWLAEQGLMNPAARQVALLAAQARAWQESPPADPVWVAGSTGGIKAVAALLRVVAGLPDGLVVLPGLDLTLDEAAWDSLDDTHPQATLRRLLAGLNATRGDVKTWEGPSAVPAGRERLLSLALLPAASLQAWRVKEPIETSDLKRLAPADQQEEAVATALILRDALETPGARAALVTPDRALAGRVAAELLRWGVVADDSAGENLADTPPAVFLRLLARAMTEGLAPVPLLALLKHPLAGAGLATASCRGAARALELAALRGPRPEAGLNGLRKHLAGRDAPPAVHDLLTRLEACLAPLLRVTAAVSATPADALAALIESAEALAATDALPGPARLWALEEGEALAAHLAEIGAALAELPEQPPDSLPGLLDAVLEGQVVRSRRALRGRDGVAEHPRVFIWGLLEARLQAVDVAVLGGLVEGVWPPATDPGPWMSRPMRARAGLPSPEERIGQAAHDFVAACCSAGRVVLSCPRRREGAPSVPARWLARLDAYLAGQQRPLTPHPAAAWAGMLDQPEGGLPRPVRPPEPRPPVRLRPRQLRVTEIETWLADPYAIYARHVLGLVPLDPLEPSTDAADYGALVHDGLDQFLKQVGTAWPANARALLREAMDHALRAAGVRQALFEWWAPRLARIADWVAGQETLRRSELAPSRIASEASGRWSLDVPGEADRIELRGDGSLAILDYKTGQPPTQLQVEAGFAPQLPLEAAMAGAGAFGPTLRAPTAELTYWHLTGGFEPGQARTLFKGDREAIARLVAQAHERLGALIVAFDRVERAYLARPHPGRVPRFPQFAQLARVAEWDLSGGES
jgi:ATP-dependent helicase/nuclease subunit B